MTAEKVTIHMDPKVGGGTITMPRDEFEYHLEANERVHQLMERTMKVVTDLHDMTLFRQPAHTDVQRIAAKHLPEETR